MADNAGSDTRHMSDMGVDGSGMSVRTRLLAGWLDGWTLRRVAEYRWAAASLPTCLPACLHSPTKPSHASMHLPPLPSTEQGRDTAYPGGAEGREGEECRGCCQRLARWSISLNSAPCRYYHGCFDSEGLMIPCPFQPTNCLQPGLTTF